MNARSTQTELDPAADQVEPTIPVLRPCLPPAERLLPYLRRIDATRIYTSWGPLVLELEERLCRRFSLPPGGVVSASSGTSALTASILAAAGRAASERRFAIVPALTFVATAAAAESCGYTLRIADVDPETWQLDPERVVAQADLDEVAVVIPVAPYGRPVPQEPWLEFRERTGISIVIDGAATFETAASQPERILGELPVAMSFHATKAFATGEGGCVASTETGVVEQIGQALNFGFWGSRDSATPSLNGKLSEYHAAVGLAELDGWSMKRDQLEGVVALYVDAFASVGLSDQLVCAPTGGLSYILFRAGDIAESASVQRSLRARGIDFRLWYSRGVHEHTHFAGVARGRLDTAEDLAARLIGLPVAPDLAPAEVRSVADAGRVGAAAEAR
jgi:dTDP-4-amino-4,6-dideoxygalactose transaminase